MKQLITLSVSLLLCTAVLGKKKVQGYYEKDGKRHDVTFIIRTDLVGKATLINGDVSVVYLKPNGKKGKLSGNDADLVSYSYKDRNIVLHSKKMPSSMVPKNSKNDKFFLHLKAEGKLNVYRYYYDSGRPQRGVSARQYWDMIEKDGRLRKVNKYKMKSVLRTYVSSCPAALEAQKNYKGKFGIDTSYVWDIITVYNKECGTK